VQMRRTNNMLCCIFSQVFKVIIVIHLFVRLSERTVIIMLYVEVLEIFMLRTRPHMRYALKLITDHIHTLHSQTTFTENIHSTK